MPHEIKSVCISAGNPQVLNLQFQHTFATKIECLTNCLPLIFPLDHLTSALLPSKQHFHKHLYEFHVLGDLKEGPKGGTVAEWYYMSPLTNPMWDICVHWRDQLQTTYKLPLSQELQAVHVWSGSNWRICIPLSNLRRLRTLLGRFWSGVFNLLSHGLSYMATRTATARLLVKWWETKGNFHIRNIIIIYTYCCEIMNEGILFRVEGGRGGIH